MIDTENLELVDLNSHQVFVTVVEDTKIPYRHSPIFYHSLFEVKKDWDDLLLNMIRNDNLNPSVLDSSVLCIGILDFETGDLTFTYDLDTGDGFREIYNGKQAYSTARRNLDMLKDLDDTLNLSENLKND